MNQQASRKSGLAAEFIHSQGALDEFDACRKAVHRHFGSCPSSRIDLGGLALGKGIVLRRAHDLPFEGMIEREASGCPVIHLRSGLNRRRERFTLAHELGHWILQEEMLGTVEGKLFRGVSRSQQELKEEERLANLLAAELLLPFDVLTESFSPSSPLNSLLQICRKFGVSRPMAIRRIADVCNCNLALIQLVPFLFKKLDSLAEVDDAVFASGRCGTLFDRNRTKLETRLPYRDVISGREISLRVRSPKGTIDACFEVNARSEPIQHAFALARLERWPTNDSPTPQPRASRESREAQVKEAFE